MRDDAATTAASREVGGRNLPVAIGTGVGLAALFLGSLFWHPVAFTLVVAGLVVLASVESSRVLETVGYRVATAPLIVASLVTLGGAYRLGHQGQVIGFLTLFVSVIAWLLVDPQRHDVTRTLSITVFMGAWIGVGASFAVLLATRELDAEVAVLAIIGAAVLTDIGGYAFGVTLGRHKIAPAVSPNKSWEGLVGGLTAAAALAAVVLPQVGDLFDVTSAIVVALAVGVASFFGDLMESMIKRDLAVKDLGDLLPGHGGILDRVDGILLALPIGFFALELLA